MLIKFRSLACVAIGVIAGLNALAAAPENFAPYPNALEISRVFSGKTPGIFKPTNLTKSDYLRLIGPNVDYFVKHQNEQGAIVDPYRKRETQYATPAFALAAGAMVKYADRQDLLTPAVKALSRSIADLASGKSADGHADFYIPLIIHAHRLLNDIAPPEAVDAWQTLLSGLESTKDYNANLRNMNWNIVSTTGELLRRKDGLVADRLKDAQWAYLEDCLKNHLTAFSPLGMYKDPSFPMAYDAFARFYLEDLLADGAYDGKSAEKLVEILNNGELTTLMLLSPIGEWPNGGRSALHNWNEAQIAAICEMAANKWKSNPALAGAFKHAAHLALASLNNWKRDSGELSIVKNRFEPDARMGFESYSYHSQYNLLPMAMLAVAYERADDVIEEKPTPAELGGYVFDLREDFHKIFAAAGGYYLEIDTKADPKYNATGIQRIHKTGAAFPFINDSSAGERDFGPSQPTKIPLSPGVVWEDDSKYRVSLAIAKIQKSDLQIHQKSPDLIEFTLKYTFMDDDTLLQTFIVSKSGVQCTETVNHPIVAFQLPALVDDGKEKPNFHSEKSRTTATFRGCKFNLDLKTDSVGPYELDAAETVNHMGKIQPLRVPINSKPSDISWVMTLE